MCAPADAGMPVALAALTGCVVIRLALDDALTLTLQGAGREAVVRIDGDAELRAGEQAARFCVDADPRAAAPALAMLHRRVRRTVLAADGTLTLECDGDLRLAALPHDHQIGWTVRLADGASATCLAEGRVVWQ